MKKFLSIHQLCRIIIATGVFFILFPLTVRGTLCPLPHFVVFLYSASAFPLFYPLGHQSAKLSLVFLSSCLVAVLLEKIFQCTPLWIFLTTIIAHLTNLFVHNHLKMKNQKLLFFSTYVWSALTEYARLIQLVLLFAAGILASLSLQLPSLSYISLSASAFLTALGFAQIYTGRLFITGSESEIWIKKNAMSASSSVTALCKDTKMMNLYERVLSYMSRTTAYLEESFDLEYLTRALGTNKTYLSRTINLCSGQNFRRFLNSYRIRYAIDLMQKDRRMKFKEVAAMSGFHTQVSFDMAFKSFSGMTPSEYMENFREPLL